MDTRNKIENLQTPQELNDKSIFGFWVYLMTDLIMFAALFATFAVLRNNTFGGPAGRDLFDLKFALAETLVLLASSYMCGLAILAAQAERIRAAVTRLCLVFALGAAFLWLELGEFSRFIAIGATPQRSAFLSSYFTLVGTHGLHIAAGLLWILVAISQIKIKGLSEKIVSKLTRFGMFWHFLDIVWIFIFTIVYLMSHV